VYPQPGHLNSAVEPEGENLSPLVPQRLHFFDVQLGYTKWECPPKCVKIKPKGGWTHEKEI